jgi:predicted transcriptional regulator
METKRSKLTIYIDILKLLRNEGPSNITSIINHSNLNSKELTECLDFLVRQSAVEKSIISDERIVFVIKQPDMIVLKFFNQI